MIYYIISLVLSAALAFVYFGAARNKLTKSMEDLAAAGLGWVKATTSGVVRLIGLLELAGAVGVILAPLGYFAFGWEWSKGLGIAAAIGLGLVMLVAIILHTVRKEIKYTWKMNLGLLALAIVDAVFIALTSR